MVSRSGVWVSPARLQGLDYFLVVSGFCLGFWLWLRVLEFGFAQVALKCGVWLCFGPIWPDRLAKTLFGPDRVFFRLWGKVWGTGLRLFPSRLDVGVWAADRLVVGLFQGQCRAAQVGSL